MLPYPFSTGAELLRALPAGPGCRSADVMLANEQAWRSEAEVRAGLLDIWRVMQECVERGCTHEGTPARRAEGPPPGAGAATAGC